MTIPAALSPEDLRRLPGLYRRWELVEVLKTDRLYRIEEAGRAADGAPLLAVFESEPEPTPAAETVFGPHE